MSTAVSEFEAALTAILFRAVHRFLSAFKLKAIVIQWKNQQVMNCPQLQLSAKTRHGNCRFADCSLKIFPDSNQRILLLTSENIYLFPGKRSRNLGGPGSYLFLAHALFQYRLVRVHLTFCCSRPGRWTTSKRTTPAVPTSGQAASLVRECSAAISSSCGLCGP
ncbi:hypothetical protein T05_16372 [Trichinella murrelli]|uniref:Uncharacterized protein n=1 Tax=Trichinella murrelli TaxID=144512 RepID=A0A0V0TD73_9BILA|nr:hypothetical protein T05_16372 [Trichinella murrelli]